MTLADRRKTQVHEEERSESRSLLFRFAWRSVDLQERRRYEQKQDRCLEADLDDLPPLTSEQKAEFKALSEMPDSEIDHSDIAPLGDAFWKNAVQNPFYKPTKTSTTVRVDSDVLAWLKGQGKGCQTRINAILREAMICSLHHKG